MKEGYNVPKEDFKNVIIDQGVVKIHPYRMRKRMHKFNARYPKQNVDIN